MKFTEEAVHVSSIYTQKLCHLSVVGSSSYVDQMLLFLLNVEFDFGDLPRSSFNFLETFSVCDLFCFKTAI